jgi:FKBP-type peptidyl-prolyl cis-trans isomerase SlyD
MKEKEVVLVEFTGKELGTGKVFDSTNAEEAKKAGIFKEKGIYEPIPVIVGRGEVIKGLDEALKEMKEGEEKTITVPPEKGFGERKKELIAVVPLKEFKTRKINPFPGMTVNINDRVGRVQSISGGRVRVDFNSELAGKTLEYKVKIVKKLVNPEEKIKALFKKYFPFVKNEKISLKEGVTEIIVPGEYATRILSMKPVYAAMLLENIEGIKKVRFIDEFEKKEK